jgi:hypothetical protein
VVPRKMIQPGALIELPAIPGYREAVRLYVREVINGRVFFGRKKQTPNHELRWSSPIGTVEAEGQLLAETQPSPAARARGFARAASLTPERRSEIARKARAARIAKEALQAACGQTSITGAK